MQSCQARVAPVLLCLVQALSMRPVGRLKTLIPAEGPGPCSRFWEGLLHFRNTLC